MEGLGESNNALLQSLTILIRTVGLPTIVGGDFNLTVEQLTESDFPQNSGLTFMTLNDTACLEGQKRCIDHVLGTPCIQRLSENPTDRHIGSHPSRADRTTGILSTSGHDMQHSETQDSSRTQSQISEETAHISTLYQRIHTNSGH